MPALKSKDIIPLGKTHSEAVREIGGHRYLVQVWTHSQWNALSESRRPGGAQPLDPLGWVDIHPLPID
jgi:hypothetical protein